MNKFYCSNSLYWINKYIIQNEIETTILEKNYFHNEILILYPSILDVKNLKKDLTDQFEIINPNFIKTLSQFKKGLIEDFAWSNKYKELELDDRVVLTESARKKFLIDILNNFGDNDNYYNKLWDYRSFRLEFLRWIDLIKSEFLPGYYLQTDNIFNLDNLTEDIKNCLNFLYAKDSLKNNSQLELIELYEKQKKEYHFLDSYDLEALVIQHLPSLIQEESFLAQTKKIYLLNWTYFTHSDLLFIKQLTKCGIEFIISFYNDIKRQAIFNNGINLQKKLIEQGFKKAEYQNKATSIFSELSNELFKEKMNEENFLPFSPDNISIIKAESYENEIESVFKIIKEIKYNNPKINYSEIAVIARNINSYYDIIQTISHKLTVPFYCNKTHSLRNEKLVHIILSILELRIKDFPNDLIVEFINSAYIYLREDKLNLENINYYYAVELLNKYYKIVKRGKDKLDIALEKLLDKTESDIEKKELGYSIHLIKKVKEYISKLPQRNEKAEIYQFVEIMREYIIDSFSILYNSYKYSDLTIAKKDSSVLKIILESLDEFNFYQYKYPDNVISLYEFYLSLKEILYNKSWAEHDNIQNHIHVLSPDEVQGKLYKHVFIVGLIENEFPKKAQLNMLFRENERLEISKKYQLNFNKEDFQNLEEFYFLMSIQSSSEKLYLSYSSKDNEGKETLKSFFLDDIALFYQQDGIDSFNIMSPKDYFYSHKEIYEHYSQDDCNQNELEMLLEKEYSISDTEINDFKFRLEAEKEKLSSYFTKYDGNLASDLSNENIELKKQFEKSFFNISASHFERYGECPHRFYFYDILNLRNYKWGEDTLSKSDKGTLVHHCLYELYKNRIEENQHLDAENLPEIRSQLKTIAVDYLKNLIDQGKQSVLVWGIELESLIDKMTDFVRKDLNENKDFIPIQLEMDFQDDVDQYSLKDKDGNIICKIKGQIDRIDKSDSDYQIIDYKTGTFLNNKDFLNSIIEGRKFQPYVYSQKVSELYNEDISNWKYYYVLDTANKNKIKENAIHLNSNLKDKMNISYNNLSEYYVKHYRNQIIDGQFLVNPRQCLEYCEFKTVCRYDSGMSLAKEENTLFWEDPDKIIEKIQQLKNESEESSIE